MKKENANKGFSLVELIIVVAIMAVLMGVLGPQYMKFVEKSRMSTDKQNVDAMISALQVYHIDATVDASSQLKNGETITLTDAGCAYSSGGNAATALSEAGLSSVKLKSSNWTGDQIVINVAVSGDTLTITTTPNLETNS